MDNSWIYRLVSLSQRRAKAVILITALLTLFLGFFALRIQIDPEIEDLVPERAEVSALLEKYGGLEDELEYLFVSVESDDLLGPKALGRLARFQDACTQIEALPGVRSSITPFDLVTFAKEGKKLALIPMAPHGRAPQSEEELDIFRRRLLEDPHARNLVIAADRSALGALFVIERRPDYTEFLGALNAIVAALEPDFSTHISSQLLFSHVAKRYLLRDVPRFVVLAVCLVLAVFYLSFRKKRAIVLPSLVVGLGTVWTLGLMSLAGFRLTFVSMMTPPLVLTLGSSYSIHILNQYFRDVKAPLAKAPLARAPLAGEQAGGFSRAVARVNKTILLASTTTAVGFASLVTAAIPQVREFGLATAAGVLICALLSLTFFPALLSRLSPLEPRHRKRVTESRSARLLAALGRRIGRARPLVWILLAVIIVGFTLSLGRVRYQTDFTSFFRRPEKAVADNLFLAEKFGTFIYVYLSVSAPGMERNYFLQPEALKRIAALEETYRGMDDVSYSASFVSYLTAMNRTMTGKAEVPERHAMISLLARYFKMLASGPDGEAMMGKFVNEDYSRLTINLRVYDSSRGSYLFEESFKELKASLEAAAAEALPAEWQPEIWGSSLGMLYLSETLSRDLLSSALVSALLILLITSVSFRSFRYGLLALIPMGTGIMLNFIIISLFRIPLDVVTVMFSCVAIGLGVDDSIHLLIQYRRQRGSAENHGEREVMARTLRYAGRPIFLTSVSLIAGLMILSWSAFTPVVYFGLLVSLAILTTTVGALFVLPAILSRKERPEAPGQTARRRGNG